MSHGRGRRAFKGSQQLWINFVHAVQFGLLHRCRAVADGLKVDLRAMHVGPIRLVFFGRNHPNRVCTQALGRDVGFDVADKPVFLGLVDELLHHCNDGASLRKLAFFLR